MPVSGVAPIAVDDSLEALLAGGDWASRAIHNAMILLVVTVLGATALAHIDLTVRAPATLQPSIDRQTLRSLSDGTVEHVFASVGQSVSMGDTLLAMRRAAVQQAISAATSALHTEENRRRDLGRLLGARALESSPPPLLLPQSVAIAKAAMVEWKQASVQVARSEQVRDREVKLMQRGFGVPAQLETAEFDLANAREERALALERRRSTWAEQQANAEQHIHDLERDITTLRATEAAHYITAPVSGTIEELSALTTGSTLRAGDAVATISPDGQVVADALVAPRDISHVRAGMSARLLVEGFDVQEWGAADATVTSIARDYTLVDGHPVFRVRLHLKRGFLRKADGLAARLGKGLRCQVRFVVGKKRLIDIVRQRTSELFDPASPDVH